ncbi:flagellar protein [Methylobacterium sp. BTF04]|uniref:flagellin N-terminal helical domain-containing protein n=1 Tax=Methylobacterium sp. BTF04 TaxID=2708300 RepID=UPI0013D0E688|nr:flagellin [Methylobacterium sp. BTF04]NEU12969.1 flagellar protein [Methylobacterium sp. BTF04]
MSTDVTLSAATRQNLLSLQDTAALTSTTQNRLSTGKKVASALDNPINFFTSQSLSNRSSDLGSLLDGISNGVQTIQAANQGLTSIQKLVDSAKSTANQALATQITTSGTAKNNFASAVTASSGTISLYVNGTAVTAAAASTASIDTVIANLNAAVSAQGAGTAFTKDTTGTKIVVSGSADIEFATTADQTTLGFQAGTAPAAKYGTTSAAGQSGDLTVIGVKERAGLAAQYNSLLTQIDQLARDASFNGVNLLSSNASTNKLHISFNEKDTSNLDIQGVDATSIGLSLTAISGDSGSSVNGQGSFLLDADVKGTLTTLTNASSTLRSQASTFGSNLSVVQNRQDFTKKIINVLDTGSSKLTDADLNEEAANSQALTTRQSLGISALSLANQAQQGVLQLLR